jgi:hypothetical protein
VLESSRGRGASLLDDESSGKADEHDGCAARDVDDEVIRGRDDAEGHCEQ